jgi:hypothetical protein
MQPSLFHSLCAQCCQVHALDIIFSPCHHERLLWVGGGLCVLLLWLWHLRARDSVVTFSKCEHWYPLHELSWGQGVHVGHGRLMDNLEHSTSFMWALRIMFALGLPHAPCLCGCCLCAWCSVWWLVCGAACLQALALPSPVCDVWKAVRAPSGPQSLHMSSLLFEKDFSFRHQVLKKNFFFCSLSHLPCSPELL